MSEEQTSGLVVVKRMFAPRVGMTSLVGIGGNTYPLEYGNYCSIAGGPYLCNMWAENLKEWARRNPEVLEIEVTVFSHAGNNLGLVTDPRLKDWCNPKPCIPGLGWPSVTVMRVVCELMGVSTADWHCGCEEEDQRPYLFQSWRVDVGNPKGQGWNTCANCKRRWKTELKP